MDLTSMFAPITKTAEQDDGSLLVYGKASDDSLDLDDQRCDMGWLDQAMPTWFKTGGNVRGQHRADWAVGKAVEHEKTDDGHYITARIVDRDAIAKTKAGVFTGFSVGIRRPKIVKADDAPNGRITGGDITEVSLVDRPANSNCMLTLCKAATAGWEGSPDDLDEERGLVKCEELTEKAADVEATADEAVAVEEAAEKAAAADKPAFDRDAALALVKKTLEKADSGSDPSSSTGSSSDMPEDYDEEQGEIAGAMQAIACIAQLIIGEAQEMCDNPAEDCDIQILLQAVAALRCFVSREQQQAMGADVVPQPEPVLMLGADADLEKGKYSAEQLRQMLKEGKAIKNPSGEPSYPIADKEDLENAIHAVGRGSGDHDEIRAYIIRRAKALGASDLIPDSWKGNGSNKAAKAEKKAAKKAAEAEQAKAAPVDDEDVLLKALTSALEKEDNALRKTLTAIVEASAEATAKSLSELGERLVKVEQMAVPGGPALRRTEAEQKQAVKADLLAEAARYKMLATSSEDLDLRRGYATKAAQIEARIKAL